MPLTDTQLTTELLPREALEVPSAASWSAQIVDGPGAGTTFDIGNALARRVLVGTSPACDIKLEDSAVSRRHAAIEADPSGLRVLDLESRNGTWIGASCATSTCFSARSRRKWAWLRPSVQRA